MTTWPVIEAAGLMLLGIALAVNVGGLASLLARMAYGPRVIKEGFTEGFVRLLGGAAAVVAGGLLLFRLLAVR